jgi:uncharacterized SAM-binding protein YcdF (DUF218 family)
MDMTPLFFGLYKFVKYAVYPLSWIIGCFGLALLLAWLPWSARRQRWLRIALTTGTALLFLAASPIVSYTFMSGLEGWYPPVRAIDRQFDAIVVLGGGIKEPGTLRPAVELSDESRHRTICGADLYQQGAAGRLVMTGGGMRIFGGPGVKVAPAMKAWAVQLGVPPDAILVDEEARTTYENALGTRRVLGQARSILLVTTAYHIPRATALFQKQGFEVTPYACGFHAKDRLTDDWDDLTPFDFLPSSGALQRMTQAVDETVGMMVYWLSGRL